jgi:cell wall-associated NlpC family hydrolase
MTEQREAVLREAESWLRTPFHQNACLKGLGVDCGTILVAVYGAVGIRVPELATLPHFPKDWHLHAREETYLGILAQFAPEIAGPPQPGDIVLFRVGRVYGHSGIVLAWPRVIHVYWGRGVEYADASKAPLAGRPARFFSPWKQQ